MKLFRLIKYIQKLISNFYKFLFVNLYLLSISYKRKKC